MRRTVLVSAGIGVVLAACGFAPPIVVPTLAPSMVPIFSLAAPAPEYPAAEPLAAALTPDTRVGLEQLLASV